MYPNKMNPKFKERWDRWSYDWTSTDGLQYRRMLAKWPIGEQIGGFCLALVKFRTLDARHPDFEITKYALCRLKSSADRDRLEVFKNVILRVGELEDLGNVILDRAEEEEAEIAKSLDMNPRTGQRRRRKCSAEKPKSSS